MSKQKRSRNAIQGPLVKRPRTVVPGVAVSAKMKTRQMMRVDYGHVRFYSGDKKPLNMLSNFSETLVRLGGDEFPSAEHAYQFFQKVNNPSLKRYFIKGGALSDWDRGYKLLYPTWNEEKRLKKIKYWKERGCIGILAKLALSKSILKQKLNWTGGEPCNYLPGGGYTIKDREKAWVFWKPILKAKFNAGSEAADVLKMTAPYPLYEFGSRANQSSLWSAKFDPKTQTLVGNNWMGDFLTRIRDNECVR